MRQVNYDRAMKLTDFDIQFLYDVYQFRCLTIQQAFDYYYYNKYDSSDEFKEDLLDSWVKDEMVEFVEFRQGIAIFVTNNTIEIIRDYYSLATNIIDSDRTVVRRGYYTSAELKILPRLIGHQVHLNRFVLDFMALAKGDELSFKHYGEKFVSHYNGIRPDALLRFYDIDIFLEQDMASESKAQLMAKWDNYRTYLRSKEQDENNRKIIMFFIIDNIESEKAINARKELVRYTATDSLIDMFSDSFDIYTGTRDELLDILFTTIIPSKQVMSGRHTHYMNLVRNRYGFEVRDASRLRQFLSDTDYTFTQYKVNTKGNLAVENGKLQEFLVDDASGNPLSMMHKVAYHKRNDSCFYRTMKRGISVIFLLDDEKSIKRFLELAKLMGTDDVYYTTVKRIEKLPFHEAVFQFDRAGQKYHFANSGLIARVFED